MPSGPPRFFKMFCPDGVRVYDSTLREPYPPREAANTSTVQRNCGRIHETTISVEDAEMLVEGLNSGTLTVEEVKGTIDS